MRFAGHEAVVIRGQAERPSYISINDAEVKIKDATSIWGIDAQTTGVILRDRESGVGRRSIIRIGPAGEAGVSYAGVVVDTYRHFGRLGLGAVFGSKKLKALVISGTETSMFRISSATKRSTTGSTRPRCRRMSWRSTMISEPR